MLLAFVFILVVAAIAVPVGIHLSNNNKKSVPTNTPEPGGTGPPVPPKVPPQSGQAPPVPPLAPPQSGQPPPVTPQSGQASVVPPPIVPLPIAPQSGHAPPVPPIAAPSVPKKYTYVRQGARNESQIWGCQLKDGKYSSVNPYQLDQLEGECSERVDCFGYYKADSGWLISTNADPEVCKEQPRPWEKYPYFYLKKEVEG
jgi:hypothetical protein